MTATTWLHCFHKEALAVAAQLARVVFGYGVGAVVAHDVVDSVA